MAMLRNQLIVCILEKKLITYVFYYSTYKRYLNKNNKMKPLIFKNQNLLPL